MCGLKEGPSWAERAYDITRDYSLGFIDEGKREELLAFLGLPRKGRPKKRPSLPIYCPPEYFWRVCECGKQGQQGGPNDDCD